MQFDPMSNGAVVVVATAGPFRKYLALRRARHDSDYPGEWGIVGGMCEPGEPVLSCAFRELREETGLTPESLLRHPFTLRFHDERSGLPMTLPVCVLLIEGEPAIRLSREHEEYAWLTASEAIQRMGWKNLADLVARIEEGLVRGDAAQWEFLLRNPLEA